MARQGDDHRELVALVDALASGRRLDAEAFDRLFPRDFAHRTLTRVEQVRAMLGERTVAEEAIDTQVDDDDKLSEDTIDTSLGDAEALDVPFPTAPGQHPRYGLEGMLGQGGVAEVYLARDRRLGRPVALKALRPEIGSTRRGRQRFIAESQTTARLAHPGIIPVHDAGKLIDGRLFFTMQKVEGRTLRSVLEALRDRQPVELARFSLPRLLAVFQRVCLTVAYAHAQGVIHRDLKPENILLGAYGEVYVADWGLSRPLDEDDGNRLTLEGEAIGTLYYMAPEQACGELEEQGPGLDVWALGVILYELLTLERPFVGKSVINLVYVIATEPPRPARPWSAGRPLPEPLVALIDDALVKDSLRRTLTAEAMADRVAAWLEGIEAHGDTRGLPTSLMGPMAAVSDESHEARAQGPHAGTWLASVSGVALAAEAEPEATMLDPPEPGRAPFEVIDEPSTEPHDTEPREQTARRARRRQTGSRSPADPGRADHGRAHDHRATLPYAGTSQARDEPSDPPDPTIRS
jgi:tRNA A-37 threonylcarbamoyl transferase component Bud32